MRLPQLKKSPSVLSPRTSQRCLFSPHVDKCLYVCQVGFLSVSPLVGTNDSGLNSKKSCFFLPKLVLINSNVIRMTSFSDASLPWPWPPWRLPPRPPSPAEAAPEVGHPCCNRRFSWTPRGLEIRAVNPSPLLPAYRVSRKFAWLTIAGVFLSS